MPFSVKPAEQVYAELGKEVSQFKNRLRLGYHNLKVLLDKHHKLIQKHDAELYPLACLAAAVTLFFTRSLATFTFFTLGALYAVSRGKARKKSIVTPIKEIWNGSTIGKMALAALLIFVAAPQKWNLAAFGFGILIAQELQKP